MGAPDKIKKLVETFTNNIESYKSAVFNETQARVQFIDPFFTALGWDVENKAGYAEAYKDVIHEFSLKTKDVIEAPDYCFRIGGTKKFFVEAKRPSVKLDVDISPAYQLRRYAWTAKLPLSILTDFEDFAVYDCRIPPNKNDKPSVSRVMFIPYTDYVDKWEEIESIFSREAVLKGSFDKYVESNKKKKGTAEVDQVFLKQMEEWRKTLAKNIALRNASLNIHELNYAVQKTLDRIIFLRICEDRGIEDYGQLMTLQNGVNVYERLKQIFHRADEKYNSGLFHFELERVRNEPPDEITLNLAIDDKALKDIIKELYYPESPYEFSVLPAEILGNVYEQFLGKVIRLTPSHHAVVEDKPEVKKAGGVYYTPTYIVDYIVKNTVGKILTPPVSSPLPKRRIKEGFTSPKEVSMLKILDPACGSGSFLLGAYQYLLDWHLKYYLKEIESNNKLLKQKQPPIYMNDRGEYLLTTFEKKRILLNNIYGVDIDPQAVEVTKLSLMLKVLEGENTQTLSNALQFFRERALPDLSNNIKCGNSLIGPDFYEQMEMQFLDDEEKLRINVFDWKKEFPQVFPASHSERSEESQGFDVVIGNPPYVNLSNFPNFQNYFSNNYKVYSGNSDLYVIFIEKIKELLSPHGYFGMIVSNKWLKADYGYKLRNWLKTKVWLISLVDFGELPVFKGVGTFPIIMIYRNENDQKAITDYSQIRELPPIKTIEEQQLQYGLKFKVSEFQEDKWMFISNKERTILNKIIKAGRPIGNEFYGKIRRGVVTGYNEAFIIDKTTKDSIISEDKASKEIIRPFVSGNDTRRYSIRFREKYLIFTRRGIEINKYPAIKKHLLKYKLELEPKKKVNDTMGRKPGNYLWYEIQDTINYHNDFELPKIIYGQFQIAPHFAYTEKPLTFGSNHYMIVSKDTDLLKIAVGILNSKLYFFVMKNLTGILGNATERGRLISQKSHFNDFPLCLPKNTDHDFKHLFLSNVNRIIDLNRTIETVKTPTERIMAERQIGHTDKQIDQLVYQLYGLTEEEIKIVERNDSC